MTPIRVVVIGAGSAGCVMAARLSEDPLCAVILFEAGPDHRSADSPDEIRGSSFLSAAELGDRHWPGLVASRAAGDLPRPYARGRGTGGSSSINAMVATPGQAVDYDEWASLYGCAGWAWADVAPWFERTLLVLNRARRHEWGPINRAFAEAWPECAGGVLLTRSATGERMSVNDCYLEPARERANLSVRGDVVVERVLLDARRAVGVRLSDGAEIEADLVVLCAGAIHSPAILLRSGVDVDGVGENLHDHPSFAVGLDLAHRADTTSLAIATVVELSSDANDRDLQLLPMEYVDAARPQLGMAMGALMRVHARGSLRVASDDPTDHPVVEFDMLSDDRDVAGLHAAVDALEQTLAHPAVAAVASPVGFDRSDAGLRAALGGYLHAAGTCAMGTVVDPRCRVVHHEGLMVCDASVMPNLPRANPHLPTVMVAERIAAATIARLREQQPR